MTEPGANGSPRLWPNPWKGIDMAKRTGWGRCWATFEALAAVETDECVLWPHASNGKGYGVVRNDGRLVLVHRAALTRRVGPPPIDCEACHAPGIGCQPLCMNYRHLRWGTWADNYADRIIDGTSVRGIRNPNAKLTEDQVRMIRSSSQKSGVLAAELGVTASLVRRVRNGARWGHAPDSGFH